jgi:hypothetical protein
MDLSSGQQRLLFVVVVLALAGLGVYLIGSRHDTTAAPPAKPSATAPPPVTSAPAATPATAPATANVSGGVNIYQWLPFTQQDLTKAAQTTVTFAADYENWTYTEPAQAYAAKMSGLVTGELSASLENAYALPGVAAQRSSQKQISSSSGTIASLQSFGSGSITFVVNIAQQLATSKGTTRNSQPFAVTLVSGASGWQVNDIEPAGAGNAGQGSQ